MLTFLLRYRDVFLIIGAVVCFIEFLLIDSTPSPEYAKTVGVLHLIASVILLITLVFYISAWKWGWVLVLRVIFGAFIGLMIYQSARVGLALI